MGYTYIKIYNHSLKHELGSFGYVKSILKVWPLQGSNGLEMQNPLPIDYWAIFRDTFLSSAVTGLGFLVLFGLVFVVVVCFFAFSCFASLSLRNFFQDEIEHCFYLRVHLGTVSSIPKPLV